MGKINSPLSSLKDYAKQELRDLIIANELKPGQRIVETEVAKRLGISQVPVREALRGLEEEGLVCSVKYKGAFVTEINYADIFYIFSLRSELEATAVSVILPRLTRRDLGELYDIVGQMALEIKNNNYHLLPGIDMRFHSRIIQLSNIECYHRIWNMLDGHIRRFIAYIHPIIPHKHEELYEDHKLLIRVLEEGAIDKAQAAFKAHIMEFFNKNQGAIKLGAND